MRYDVVVVGAGPAGSTCAYELSKKGLKVLLVEKKPLPRFKLCAGCLSRRTEYLLPFGWEKLILNTIYSGVLRYKDKSFSLESEEPIAYIIDRGTFDQFLAHKAQEQGAHIIFGEFSYFEREGSQYKVFIGNRTFTCDFIIGADGFHSKVAKLLGYRKEKFYRSVEFFSKMAWNSKEVEINIGLVKRGYLWRFPKGDSVSIGVATTYKEDMLDLIKRYGSVDSKIYGWHIPFAEKEGDLHLGKERVLLVGDAGNFVDPLLGEGIHYAILSAKRASESIAKNPSNPQVLYGSLTKDLADEFKYASSIACIGYRFQNFAFLFGKLGGLELYYRLLKGDLNYRELYKRGLLNIFKIPFKIIHGN